MANANPLKVLLIEDSKVLAERLAEAILQIPGVDLVATVDREDEAVRAMQRAPMDVLIVDLHLKQGNGFGVLKAARRIPNHPKSIVLTNYDLPEYRREAEELGATYFLDKAREYHRLPEVLQAISDARKPVSN
jgi:DNA-binding NarL/FixJ family response regulator